MAPINAVEAFTFYERVRHRLPKAEFPAQSKEVKDILTVAEAVDVLVFDAYGVLNVGLDPVVGARAQIDALRAMGKKVIVLTNGASLNAAATFEKFNGLGFDFSQEEIVSSRLASEMALHKRPDEWTWGVASRDDFQTSDLPVNCVRLLDDPATYDAVDAIMFLSSSVWNDDRQSLLLESLKKRARLVLVANPDVVAPYTGGFSIEPGYFSHLLGDDSGCELEFHGKPFTSVFEIVEERFPGVAADRFCMVGDTLHTDILGGCARGWQTALVTSHGLFRGMNVNDFIASSRIVPDWIIPSI